MVMDILHLYICFLLIAPSVLWLASRNAFSAFVASYAVYVLAQTYPLFDYHTYPEGFNPFAWQFLYCTGLLIGAFRPAWLSRMMKNKLCLVVSILGLVIVVAVRKLVPYLLQPTMNQAGFWVEMVYTFPATSKPTLHPLRLLNFFFLARVVMSICPPSTTLAQSWSARRFIQCGQHSLTIFCISVALNYWEAIIAVPTSKVIPVSLTVPILDLGGVIVLLAIAGILSLRKVKLPVKTDGSQ